MEDIFFEPGDIVILMEDSPEDNHFLKRGDIGRVIGRHENFQDFIRVRWDKNVGGHSCGGLCEDGYGWNVLADSLELASDIKDLEFDTDDFEKYFSSLMLHG